MEINAMKEFLEGSIADMLNGEIDESTRSPDSFVVTWLNRYGNYVKTQITVTPKLVNCLASFIDTEGHEIYITFFEQIEDYVNVQAFSQRDDAKWIISENLLNIAIA